MKTITLTKGYEALVDDADYGWLSQFKWTAVVQVTAFRTRVYAFRQTGSNKKRVTLYMHKEILKPPDGLLTDHIDGNGINNQRANLRIASKSQNRFNQCKRTSQMKPPQSRFRGVSRDNTGKKWTARIIISRHLGTFRDEVDAATAWNFAAEELHGEFASYNLPQTPTLSFERNAGKAKHLQPKSV